MVVALWSWVASASPGTLAVEHARTWLGTEFRWNGRGTERLPGLDCLGLVFRAWGEVTGTSWREYAVDPSELVASRKLGTVVPELEGVDRESLDVSLLQPGDIVYLLLAEQPIPDTPLWVTLESRYWPWHVGMYAGDGKVINADPSRGVVEMTFDELAWDRLVVTRR
jgi:cell wall-associated NlpC family hydrolase